MSYHKPYRRILAMALSIIVTLGILPVSAAAEEPPIGTSSEIISFETLPEKTANQTVPLGTSLEELDLPEALTATMCVATAADVEEQAEQGTSDQPVSDSGEAAQDRDEAADPEDGRQTSSGDNEAEAATGSAITPEVTQTDISVPITWVSAPDYDGNAAGVYTFTPEIESFTLANGVRPPQITVTVGIVAGETTAFAALSDDVRWQSVEYGTVLENLNLPKTLSGTVEGRQAEVPVTWEAEPSYDGQAKGLYLFAAVPGEGFTASTELPVIAVVVRGEASRFTAFSRGGGALDTDPFLIDSAAQLAAIAEIVNEGRLEPLFLGAGSSGQVYLKLENDLDLSGYTNGGGWSPIGKDAPNPFNGSFDGGGHQITGLFISRSGISPSASYQGLFGKVGSGGLVKDLGIAYANITGGTYVGGAVGYVNGGTVQNCYVSGSVSGDTYVGGVAGIVVSGTVQSCYAAGSVSGTSYYAGGVVGDNGGSVMDCAALNPTVSGNDLSFTGRVLGSNSGSLSGNIAFGGMTVNSGTVSGGAGNDKNGAAKSIAELQANTGFPAALTTAPWTWTPGKLPGLNGRTEDMPAHLLGNVPFEGGGIDGDPYKISTAAQLARLAELVNAGDNDYNSKWYLLQNDLDLSGYTSGEGWTPIGGDDPTPFRGSFDGGGHQITGLFISRSGADFQGLFGCVGSGGAVEKLGIVGTNITGQDFVGSVAGAVASGTVKNCYATGNVSGRNDVGGVAGVVASGTVQSSYATGSVTGANTVGGVAGVVKDGGTIANCAALNPAVNGSSFVGRVTGDAASGGPLSGNIAFGGITVNGGMVSGGSGNDKNGAPQTADEIKAGDSMNGLFSSAGGWTTAAGKLPGLNGQAADMPAHLLGDTPFEGSGTGGDPYKISTAAQLARLAQLVNNGDNAYNAKWYQLENDLDLSGYTGGGGWTPIGGSVSYPFNGRFNGGGHQINGLFIRRPGNDYQGLFGCISIASRVEGLSVVGVNITGANNVGGVAGFVESGMVQNCYVTGSVSGANNVGGVVGSVAPGTVQNCYSTGSVSGAYNVGGVVGSVGGAVQNCYSTGSSIGSSMNIGGVAGYVNGGSVRNCAALNPSVGSGLRYGRMAGGNDGGTLSGGYSFVGMTGGGSDKNTNGTDGADMSAGQAVTAGFWTAGANWDTSGWSGTVWTVEDGKLPLLKNLAGQSGTLPAHLLRFSTTPLTAALSGTGVSGSGTSYSAPFSSSDRVIIVTVTGWEGWTNPAVTVTAKKPNNDAITVTPQDTASGNASFVLPGSLSGDFTITAAAKSNPDNVKTTLTLTIGAAPTITASAGAGGSISPGGSVTVPTGGNQTFTIAPDDGHIIASVTVDGVNRGAIPSYTFTNVTGDHTISAAFTNEQFGLSPGGTYYFDLSGQGIPGTVNTGLPDTSLKWVPFTYAGTVNAYSLDASSNGDVSASGNAALSDRSLFAADYVVAHTVSWDDLNAADLIFGKYYMTGGIEYKLRSLSVGSTSNGQSGADEHGMPGANEWDQLLNKDGGFVKNWSNGLTWGQDTSSGNSSSRALRGYTSVRVWASASSSTDFSSFGFRPALELLNPGTLGSGGLKTVTYNMGGNGKLGGGLLTSATVVYTGTLVLPEVSSANGFVYTGSGTGTLGWWSGGTFYAPGAAPGLAAGATLTAGYESSSTPLATPTGLSWDGTTPGKATWSTVSNASSYSVQLYKGGAVQGGPVTGITTTEYSFTSVITSAGNGSYTFRVTAVGDGTSYTNSAESAASEVYTYTSGTTTYTITASAGSGGSISPSGTVFVAAGGSQTFTITPTNRNYSISNVTVDSASQGAIATYTFTNVRGNHTISATFCSTGGNSGGSSSGDGGSGSSYTIIPDKKPDQPVIAGFSVTPAVDAKGHATILISQKDVESAIKKALTDAKAQGKITNGIGISIKLDLPDTAKALGIVLPRTTLKSLIDAGVKQFEIDGVMVSLDFDQEALKEIFSQSTGAVTITIKPEQNLSKAAKKLIDTRPVYDVIVSGVKAGKSVNIISLGSGSITLGIPYAPGKNEAAGYLCGVYVDGSGKAGRISGSVYDSDSGRLILDSNHFSVYGIGYATPTEKYTDITGHWAKESIDYAVGRGLFSGTIDTTFDPNTAMNRGMLVTVLGRLAGADVSAYKTSSFSDVSMGKYYPAYVEWAYKMGIVSGTGNGKFNPERTVTREEIALILQNYAKATGYTLPVTREAITYADASSIGSAYKDAVKAMQQAGIMIGDSNNRFNPKAGATRAEVSAMLHRYIKLTIDPATAQGWAKNDNGQRMFFTKDGVMVAGQWLQIASKWYYFYADGSLAKNTVVNGYEVDENGARKIK